MKPNCSIVIRAFNEEKHIGRLLTGIFQQTVKDVQVILVDSGSTDTTVHIASSFQVEVVHIQPEDFTFGYSLNQGIVHAHADIVVIASAHVYPVYPDWLEKLLLPLKDQKIALSYGKQRGMETTKFSEHMIFQQWFPDHTVKRQDHPFCNNANAAIRREIWEAHPFDETIPALEDLAWANWVQKQGFQIAYASEAEIIHVHDESFQGVFNRYRREGMAFKRIYPQEHFSFGDFIRLFSVNVWSDAMEMFRLGKSISSLLEVVRFRWAQFWGTYQGYRQSSGPLTWKLKKTFYYPKSNLSENPSRTRDVEPIQYPDKTGINYPGRSQ
jgi:glycosyltransferase involved in cell wall biosynthesis